MSSIENEKQKRIWRTATPEDLTAKARIFDAAIEAFARYGSKASVRNIAVASGVSPGLVIHHFHSKQSLRKACDAEVLKRYHELEVKAVVSPVASVGAVEELSEESGMIFVYMLRSLADGGSAARKFMSELLVETEEIMKVSLDQGLINPSVNESARSEFWSMQTIGYMLLRYLLEQPDDPLKFVRSIWKRPELVIAQVESMTTPLLKDDSILKALCEIFSKKEEQGERSPP
jgi:AcrR family transcriptional regulator